MSNGQTLITGAVAIVLWDHNFDDREKQQTQGTAAKSSIVYCNKRNQGKSRERMIETFDVGQLIKKH